MFKHNKLEYYPMQFSSPVEIYHEVKKIPNKNLFHESFQDSRLAGFLETYSDNMFTSFFTGEWSEIFVVMTEMGLLCFKEIGDSNCCFIPVKGATLL